jgi:ribosome assembly protein 1
MFQRSSVFHISSMTIDMLPSKAGDSPRGTVKGASSQNLVKFTIRAVPLPPLIQTVLLENTSVLKKLQTEQSASDPRSSSESTLEDDVELEPTLTSSSQVVSVEQFWEQLQSACAKAGDMWRDVPDKVWAFGPQNAGGCVLIDMRSQPVQHK